MPGQMRGSKRGRGDSRGGGGRGGGGPGGGGRGISRGRSSSRGGGGVVRQNDDSFPTRGGHAKRGRGGAGHGGNPDRRWRKESGSVHSSSGQEMKEPSIQRPENQQLGAVNVDKEASKSTAERQLVGKKGKKGGKNKSDCKASLKTAESQGEGTKANLPSEVKLLELRKPELKPFVKNPNMKISKEPPPSDPVKKTLPSKEVIQKSELELPVAPFAKLVDDSKLNISDQTSQPMNLSNSTGLRVLSITSSFPGYVFTTNDRAKLVRNIPGVVIINTANKGDKLVLGVDIEVDRLASLLPQFEDQNNWNVSTVDTTDKDTFAYFAGWKLIPRVDKSGMFQLIVNLRTQGSRSRDAEMKRRNQLLDLVKDLNIAKIVHGEGETILLVSHVLECVAYSDLIRKKFTLEKRHTWLPKSVLFSNSPVYQPGKERHFWVKVKDPELNNLTTAHKQYTVYHQLSNAGKVLQLEHQLFGVEDNYLVVYSDMGDVTMPVLGQQFCLLELLPDALPDIYSPSYGVDAWGFYSVSGKFPENVSDESRNKFAEDMKKVGAVGFRSGEAEDTFSLHFVNSRCLEQISRCAQFSSFRLTILSSLVRKPRFEKKLMKMVPSILKYKELKLGLGDKKEVKPAAREHKGIAANHEKTMEEIEVLKMESIEPKSKPAKVVKEEEKTLVKDIKLSKKAKTKASKEKVKPTKGMEGVVVNEGHVVSEMSNKKVAMMEKAKEALKNVEATEKKVAPALVDESLRKFSESELLRICWKKEGSLHTHLDSLGKFLKSLKEVVVSEVENSEVAFSFAEKEAVEVLNLMSSDCTNSLEKIEAAPQKVQVQASKFFKNKFGLVLEKNCTISRLKKDFSKFGVEIEVRSQVYVLWCDSKLGFYEVLTDPGTVGYKWVPSVQNFKFAQIKKKFDFEEKKIAKTKKKVDNEEKMVAKNKKKADIEEKKMEVPGEISSIQLTEREIFGFIWQKSTGKINIRDDQVISRQLTNFIKTVVCEDLSTDEDGVVVTFSTQAEKTAALTRFCPAPVPDREQLAALARKFTLLPSRGFFGLFSVKRVKPEHFTRFGDCKIRNCGIWFTDKLSMCTVLRDPFIRKTYPTLFIDCRNIYILSSQKSLPQVKPDKQEKPAATSSLKTCHVVTSPPCHGVVTRSAMARMSPPNPLTPDSKEEKKDEDPEKLPATSTPDPAILTAVTSPVPAPPATPCHCPLLSTLLPKPALTVLGQGKFGYNLGKVGHIPSARLVRTGYKQSKMLDDKVRVVADEHLFLDDKDCYRSKDVKEAASLISNILEGKMSEVGGNTLREIKMKRVEHFLKDKLGVECRLSKEGKDMLQAGGMIIKYEGETGERGEEIKLDVTSAKIGFEEQQNMDKGVIEVENIENGNNVVDNQEDKRKQRLLKKEAERREFEKRALIFPEEVVHEDYIVDSVADEQSRNDVATSVLESVEKPVDESPNLIEPTSRCVLSAKTSLIGVSVLTPDLIGFYTLTLPVPQGPDLNIFSALQEDISWFDTPVSILCIENKPGGATLEVKFRDQDMAMAVLQGLKHKYLGLEGDETGMHADMVKDKETGLFTLCFTDSKRKRYKATMEKFRVYSKLSPVISRGVGAEQVLVAFNVKEEAVLALKENIGNEEFPELHVAPVSRG